MSVIEIPGGKAQLRDKLVRERDFRIIEASGAAAQSVIAKMGAVITDEMSDEEKAAALSAIAVTRDEGFAMLDLQDAAIVAYLESWTLPRKLPTLDDVQELDRDLYQPIAAAAMAKMMSETSKRPDFALKLDEKGKIDPESPTTGSTD